MGGLVVAVEGVLVISRNDVVAGLAVPAGGAVKQWRGSLWTCESCRTFEEFNVVAGDSG